MKIKFINDWKHDRTFFKVFNLDLSEYKGGVWFEFTLIGFGIFIHSSIKNDKLKIKTNNRAQRRQLPAQHRSTDKPSRGRRSNKVSKMASE